MKCNIVLKRKNDIDRIISFDSENDVKVILKNIYAKAWDLIFDQTPDSKFAVTFSLHLFSSVKLMFNFYAKFNDPAFIAELNSFDVPFNLLVKILHHFNYWAKNEEPICYIIALPSNEIVKAQNIQFINVIDEEANDE